ncbi:MAG: Holliday junction resolvase RuvX [Patescibacteria group bacterium]
MADEGVVLCLDYGERYVGVAITDVDGEIALRYSVVDTRDDDVLDEVEAMVEEEDVSKILVGVPRSLSGEESDQTHICLAFVEDLRDRLPSMPIEEVDETFTSLEAERTVAAEGSKKEEAHAEAARLMLESYLKQHVEL